MPVGHLLVNASYLAFRFSCAFSWPCGLTGSERLRSASMFMWNIGFCSFPLVSGKVGSGRLNTEDQTIYCIMSGSVA